MSPGKMIFAGQEALAATTELSRGTSPGRKVHIVFVRCKCRCSFLEIDYKIAMASLTMCTA